MVASFDGVEFVRWQVSAGLKGFRRRSLGLKGLVIGVQSLGDSLDCLVRLASALACVDCCGFVGRENEGPDFVGHCALLSS